VYDERSQALAWLFGACLSNREKAKEEHILPSRYYDGDLIMVEQVRVEPQYRGYGIILLAMAKLIELLRKVRPIWAGESLIVLDPWELICDRVP
jgi:hypothetical protein